MRSCRELRGTFAATRCGRAGAGGSQTSDFTSPSASASKATSAAGAYFPGTLLVRLGGIPTSLAQTPGRGATRDLTRTHS